MKKRPGYSIRAALIIGVFAYAYYRTDNLYASGAGGRTDTCIKAVCKGDQENKKETEI